MNSSMLKPIAIARRKRYLRVRIAADERVVHVEVGERERRRAEAKMRDALACELGLELAVVEHAPHVVAAEREQSRLPCMNASSCGCDSSMMLISMRPICGSVLPRIVSTSAAMLRVAAFREAERAVVRIRLEHDARAPSSIP